MNYKIKILFILIVSIINNNILISQKTVNVLQVSYIESKFNGDVITSYNLYLDNESSIYEEKVILDKNKVKAEYSEKGTTLKINNRTVETPNFYYRNNNDLFFRIVEYNEELLIKDESYKIDWDTSYEDTKDILGFLCNKATSNFRGNKYEVWYTTDIPSSFGPWKLFGLPGLILKVNTESNVIDIQAVDIQTKNQIDIDEKIKFYESKNYDLALSMDDYFERLQELREAFYKRINSNLPKDVKPFNMKKKCDDCGVKLEYF